jgi:hypothetical protein
LDFAADVLALHVRLAKRISLKDPIACANLASSNTSRSDLIRILPYSRASNCWQVWNCRPPPPKTKNSDTRKFWP